jgi:hypothetical protein|tara:strand:- start:632 stop:805 length:174 start_codon:yes stop_codon:yes gene_type:complete
MQLDLRDGENCTHYLPDGRRLTLINTGNNIIIKLYDPEGLELNKIDCEYSGKVTYLN